MTKKQFILLLLPSVLFVQMGVLMLMLSRTPKIPPTSQTAFEDIVRKVNQGELSTNKIVHLLSSSRTASIVNDERLSEISLVFRVFGWGALVTVVLQVYLILRIGYRRRDA
jgi:hypothetical protein